jgi:branched-chain amino acid transport system ATP-binding protein
MKSAVLSVDGVTVRFGGVIALDGVDFHVEAGSITGIIGPNGAGKTTLLNAVTGMVQPSEGSISFDNRDVTAKPAHKRAAAGLVRTFQNLEIFTNMSVLENVMTGRHVQTKYSALHCLLKTPRYRKAEAFCRDKAMECLDFVGIADKADDPAGDLPFGLQRHVEIARALAAEPVCMLLDEPAAGLNMKETHVLGRIITRINKELGITVAMVEHDMDLVMGISDRGFVLHFGRGLASGTPQEVRADPEVVKAYLGEDDEE